MADKAKNNSSSGNIKSGGGPRGLVAGLPVLIYDERANMGMRVNHWKEKFMIHVRSGDYFQILIIFSEPKIQLTLKSKNQMSLSQQLVRWVFPRFRKFATEKNWTFI
jgi:hypothetical protein